MRCRFGAKHAIIYVARFHSSSLICATYVTTLLFNKVEQQYDFLSSDQVAYVKYRDTADYKLLLLHTVKGLKIWCLESVSESI